MNALQITRAVNELSDERAKQLLGEILLAKSYSNQEVYMKVQEILDELQEGVHEA